MSHSKEARERRQAIRDRKRGWLSEEEKFYMDCYSNDEVLKIVEKCKNDFADVVIDCGFSYTKGDKILSEADELVIMTMLLMNVKFVNSHKRLKWCYDSTIESPPKPVNKYPENTLYNLLAKFAGYIDEFGELHKFTEKSHNGMNSYEGLVIQLLILMKNELISNEHFFWESDSDIIQFMISNNDIHNMSVN